MLTVFEKSFSGTTRHSLAKALEDGGRRQAASPPAPVADRTPSPTGPGPSFSVLYHHDSVTSHLRTKWCLRSSTTSTSLEVAGDRQANLRILSDHTLVHSTCACVHWQAPVSDPVGLSGGWAYRIAHRQPTGQPFVAGSRMHCLSS
eukprot:1661016-Rhodomonas_salina.2